MDQVVHADIFFFITSIAVILVTVGVLVILYYLIPAARNLRDIVARIHKASGDVEKDFEDLRSTLRQEGLKGKMLVDIVLGWIERMARPPVRRRAAKKVPPSSEV
ncbi:MAG TPA: hypothetical protein VG753_01595 [Candidatus Paceibacterota bacterium]|nr:hypothetical protein [Candidatus Paceibacterota bacterium]